MLYRICGVNTPSYPGFLRYLGSARPTGVMPGLIAHSVLRAPRGRLLGAARQRLARSSLGRLWAVFIMNMSG
jgi:hypothetical protein